VLLTSGNTLGVVALHGVHRTSARLAPQDLGDVLWSQVCAAVYDAVVSESVLLLHFPDDGFSSVVGVSALLGGGTYSRKDVWDVLNVNTDVGVARSVRSRHIVCERSLREGVAVAGWELLERYSRSD